MTKELNQEDQCSLCGKLKQAEEGEQLCNECDEEYSEHLVDGVW